MADNYWLQQLFFSKLLYNLFSEVQTVAQLNEDKEMLESHIHDLEAEISGGTNNQSQLLEFTEKLTAKNVQLQSEVTSIQSKVRQGNTCCLSK